MITVKCTGDFTNTQKFLQSVGKQSITEILNRYGKLGVDALKANTPKDSGDTASRWKYTVSTTSRGSSISWNNDAVAGKVPIVILLQYGHATGTGGYVSGVDFINPSLKKVFEDLSNAVWKEVIN